MTAKHDDLNAMYVGAGPEQYIVTYAQKHKTLKVGDVVKMLETPSYCNVLIRVIDWTLHDLQDSDGQYVLLRPR